MPLEWFGCFMVSERGRNEAICKVNIDPRKDKSKIETWPYYALLGFALHIFVKCPAFSGQGVSSHPSSRASPGSSTRKRKGVVDWNHDSKRKKMEESENETSEHITRLYKIASWFFLSMFRCSSIFIGKFHDFPVLMACPVPLASLGSNCLGPGAEEHRWCQGCPETSKKIDEK